MAFGLRFLRAKHLKPNEVQAKIPTLTGPRAKRTFTLIPVRDPEIYPLLVCVGSAVALFAAYNTFNFATNPDVCMSKTRREMSTSERYDPEQVRAYVNHRAQLAALTPNAVNTNPSFDMYDAQHAPAHETRTK